MQITIKALIDNKWQALPCNDLQGTLEAIKSEYTIVACITYDGGDQKYYATTQAWVDYYQKKGEMVDMLPPINEALLDAINRINTIFEDVKLASYQQESLL
jgi:hypothetical protein